MSDETWDDEAKAKWITNFVTSQPGYKEGVERSRQQIAEGKCVRMTGDDFRERIRQRKLRGPTPGEKP